MSTLGGMISYAFRPRFKNRNWLPRDKWEKKLRKEGRWVDYKNKKQRA